MGINWLLMAEISSALNELEHQNVIDISTEELAVLLESLYRQVTNCWDKGDKKDPINWECVLAQAYDVVGWTECKPSKEVINMFNTLHHLFETEEHK